jgi:DNA-binding SARP family transcriptional activator
MSILRLQLFGRFSASCGTRAVNSFDSCKVQELFCYLVLSRKPHSREMLAALLWGDSDNSQAKKYLRKALWQLQATLERNLGPLNHRIILVEADWIRFNPEFELWLDVAEFERACEIKAAVPGDTLDEITAGRLIEAVQLYQGELLEGCYQDWCLFERQRLQNIYLATLHRLICYSEANRLYQQALTYAQELLRHDPALERAHRQIMRIHFALGDRVASLRQYQRCVAALKTDLGVKPSSRTRALAEKIQADEFDSFSLPGAADSLPVSTASSLPEVLDHLKIFRTTLHSVLKQVQKDIRTVEMVLINRQ